MIETKGRNRRNPLRLSHAKYPAMVPIFAWFAA